MRPRADWDVARSFKAIEWLKTELLSGVAELFRAMRQAREDRIADQLANIIMATYVLGRRLGIDFPQLDSKLRQKVRANAEEPHDFEEWYGDFSTLERYLNSGER